MKIDFENYEVTVADGLETHYIDEAKCKREETKAKCREWAKGKKREDIKATLEQSDASVSEDMKSMFLDMKDDEMEELCNANIFNSLSSADTSVTSTMDELLTQVNYGFSPVVGSFTVGHSLLKFGERNQNKDLVPMDKIDYYLKSVVGQGCTWGHDMEILIGSVINATVHYPTNIVLLNTRFWEARPECAGFVEEVKNRYKRRNLKFSFEIITAKVACSECGNEYPTLVNMKKDHYCSHLKARFEPGSQVSRILTNFIPIGEGVTDKPAFGESKALIAASKTEVVRLAQAVEELNKLIKSKIR